MIQGVNVIKVIMFFFFSGSIILLTGCEGETKDLQENSSNQQVNMPSESYLKGYNAYIIHLVDIEDSTIVETVDFINNTRHCGHPFDPNVQLEVSPETGELRKVNIIEKDMPLKKLVEMLAEMFDLDQTFSSEGVKLIERSYQVKN